MTRPPATKKDLLEAVARSLQWRTVEEVTYTAPVGAPAELTVVCAQCSFPVIKEHDANGKVTGFHEEVGPADEEAALAEGWLDHGMGLYCPKCSLAVLEESAQAAYHSTHADIGEIIDAQVLRTFAPGASDDTVQQFVKMFRAERLSKFRVLAGMEPVQIPAPVPKSEEQAKEFLEVVAALKAAKESLK